MNSPIYLKLVARWVITVSGVLLALTPVMIISMAFAGYAGSDEMRFMTKWATASAGFLIIGVILEWVTRRQGR